MTPFLRTFVQKMIPKRFFIMLILRYLEIWEYSSIFQLLAKLRKYQKYSKFFHAHFKNYLSSIIEISPICKNSPIFKVLSFLMIWSSRFRQNYFDGEICTKNPYGPKEKWRQYHKYCHRDFFPYFQNPIISDESCSINSGSSVWSGHALRKSLKYFVKKNCKM